MRGGIAVIAPGHDSLDHRVNRSFNLIKSIRKNSTLFLESSRLDPSFNDTQSIQSYKPVSIVRLFFLFRSNLTKNKMSKYLKSCDKIYIHDSGLYGLILVRYLSKYYSKKPIIFDYHDFLDWEIEHHISKFITNEHLRSVAHKAVNKILGIIIFSKVRLFGLIGISEKQIKILNAKFKYECKNTFYVPNTRIAQPKNFINRSLDESWNLLWVGNISGNRSIENIKVFQDLLKKKFTDTKVNCLFVGKVWGPSSQGLDIENLLGSYNSDEDIIELLPSKKILGVFFGWHDKHHIGINEVGSPNKVYSYINIGLPFLIHSKLKNVIKECSIDESFIYFNEDDFLKKSSLIFNNYDHYCRKVQVMKNNKIWDSEVSKNLSSYYSEILSH